MAASLASGLSAATLDDQNCTTIASLPKEILAIVVEYGTPDAKFRFIGTSWTGRRVEFCFDRLKSKFSWLGGLLRIGCVNRSFLEALKCVGTLRIEVLQRRRRGRFDDCVQGGAALPAAA